jgi:hypothetical protein
LLYKQTNMKKSIRLIEIQETINALMNEYKTASDQRRKQITKQYHALNQEHCKLAQNAYKTTK